MRSSIQRMSNTLGRGRLPGSVDPSCNFYTFRNGTFFPQSERRIARAIAAELVKGRSRYRVSNTAMERALKGLGADTTWRRTEFALNLVGGHLKGSGERDAMQREFLAHVRERLRCQGTKFITPAVLDLFAVNPEGISPFVPVRSPSGRVGPAVFYEGSPDVVRGGEVMRREEESLLKVLFGTPPCPITSKESLVYIGPSARVPKAAWYAVGSQESGVSYGLYRDDIEHPLVPNAVTWCQMTSTGNYVSVSHNSIGLVDLAPGHLNPDLYVGRLWQSFESSPKCHHLKVEISLLSLLELVGGDSANAQLALLGLDPETFPAPQPQSVVDSRADAISDLLTRVVSQMLQGVTLVEGEDIEVHYRHGTLGEFLSGEGGGKFYLKHEPIIDWRAKIPTLGQVIDIELHFPIQSDGSQRHDVSVFFADWFFYNWIEQDGENPGHASFLVEAAQRVYRDLQRLYSRGSY